MQVLEPGGFLDRDGANQVVWEAPLAGGALQDLIGGARELPVHPGQQPAVPERVVAPHTAVARPYRKCRRHGARRRLGVVLLHVLWTRFPARVMDLVGALGVGGKRRPAAGRPEVEIPG